jgi:hypothetical protein
MATLSNWMNWRLLHQDISQRPVVDPVAPAGKIATIQTAIAEGNFVIFVGLDICQS